VTPVHRHHQALGGRLARISQYLRAHHPDPDDL
jgi:hypothetical protein